MVMPVRQRFGLQFRSVVAVPLGDINESNNNRMSSFGGSEERGELIGTNGGEEEREKEIKNRTESRYSAMHISL